MASESAPRWPVVVATGFYSGYFPFAPGTVGSAVALPMAFALRLGGPVLYAVALGLSIALAVYASGVVERTVERKDPSCIVVDEMVGMMLTLFLAPLSIPLSSWQVPLAGFVLFRVFDIIKPFPGRRLEKLPGGWGIVADDLMAAIYANIVVRALIHFGLVG
ncbi:MAG: phosphatidylglycerophosphatase A [Acidobacteriota bacterium]